MRLEPLEQRELLAVADGSGGELRYEADAGEVNDVVLSAGRFFSIQDAADVAQVGEGGCVASNFLGSLSWSIGAEAGTDIGSGIEVSVAVGVGFGGALLGINLPEGMICPSPKHLTTAGNVNDSLQDAFGNITKGVASAVAGAAVTESGSVYYEVSASNGTVDEYRLYQNIVDPTAVIDETESNNSFGEANTITTGTLVEGNFDAGAGDADFYKFDVVPGDRIAVVLDNNALGDNLYANTRLTLYDSTGEELSSNVGFSDGSAIGAVEVPGSVLPGPYYVSVVDNGFGDGKNYRFVVIATQTHIDEDVPKPTTFDSGTIDAEIPDMGSTESTLPVNVGDAFARAKSMTVNLNILHTYDGDLTAYLISPSGTTITLFANVGGPGDNFTNTTFSDSAAIPIAWGTPPFTGTYLPQQPLDTFKNDLINGQWKLRIVDGAASDDGTLVSWSLTFNVANNDTPANADPLAMNQYANGDVPSGYDIDYFKVTDATIQPGDLVFAYVDTYDTDGENTDSRDSYLKVISASASTVIGEDDDDGPAVSNSSYDDFNKDIEVAGVDLAKLVSFDGPLTVDLKDGNDRCDASKLNLDTQTISISGGDGSDTILGPGGKDVTLTGGFGNDTFVFNQYAPATVTIHGDEGLNDTLLIEGTSGNDLIAVKMSGANLVVWMNGVEATYLDMAGASIENLAIDTGGGDDTVRIDCSGGPIVFANSTGVTFEGSAGRLEFTSGLVPVDSNTLNIGPIAGSGMSTIEMNGQSQVVEFTGVSPVLTTLVVDDVLGPMKIIGTDADNALTLDAGLDPGTALLSVDDLATIELANKTGLTLDAGAGNDTVHLQRAGAKALTAATAPLVVNGGSGDDTIIAENGLELSAVLTLDGGAGNDTLNADATLTGGPGDDILIGGTGDNTYDGGGGFDTILVRGTLSDDLISLEQTTGPSTLKHSITTGGVTASGTDTFSDIDVVQVDAGSGDDTVEILVADALVASPGDSLPFTVNGEAPNASDRLVVVDAGSGDVTILRQGPDQRSGSISVGPLSPVVYSGIEKVDVIPVNSTADGYGGDGLGRLVVIPTDPLEANDSRRVAVDLERLLESHVPASIDPLAASGLPQNPTADEDWYKFTAPKTGTFSFQLDFQPIGKLINDRAGLPGDGELKITAYDKDGNAIAKILGEGSRSHTIGVEAGKTYYVRVQGATADAVNVYDINLVDVDIYGPQVTEVAITGSAGYNLFTQKQLGAGSVPTPLVWSLSISIQDAVLRRPDFLYPALNEAVGENPGHYRLVGDANGLIAIDGVDVINDPVVAGSMATATIILHFASPLPDDRYTLTIADEVTDPSGNRFDGETNTLEPRPDPTFPSGDGVAGGDFAARFTVDSRPEIGAWASGSIYVDINGNFQYDPTNADASNRDYAYSMGFTSDVIFAGNFAPIGGSADGFSKLAVYGKLGKTFRWLIDANNDGVADIIKTDTANIVGAPLAGNFDGISANGDEVALFDGKAWYIDMNRDYSVRSSGDLRIADGLSGMPIVGDFDGDGKVDLATYKAGKFSFDLAWNNFGTIDTTIDVGYLSYAGARLRPVAADMDMDGITDIGLWCPDRAGADSGKTGEWYLLVSDDPTGTLRVPHTVNRLNHSFSLLPPSKDIFAQMGSEFAVPVVGNFDPPVVDASGNPVASTDPVTVSLAGTSRSERFAVAPGAEAGTWVVTLDGKSQTLQAASLDLSIDGGGGRDSVSLAAAAADDRIECWPGRAEVVGVGYTMSVRGVPSITIDAGAGDNSATLHGSPGSDKLTASATTTTLAGSGYSNRVLGARHVVVDGGSAGNDSATLTGTAGSDAFFASLASASLSGADYRVDVAGFHKVRVQAGSGGLDTAALVGSSGDDVFTATSRSCKLSGKGFLFEATGFDVVSADGGGGSDTASISGGVMDGPLSSDLIGTLPEPYRAAAWLSHFTRIQHDKKLQSSAAVDQVFGAFWK